MPFVGFCAGGMLTADMARERERRDWERDQERSVADEEAEDRRRKQKQVCMRFAQLRDL